MSFLDYTPFEGEAHHDSALSMSSAHIPLREDAVVPSAQSVRREVSLAMTTDAAMEVASREYTSEEIDQGVLGQHHPVTGNCLIGTLFDPEKGVFVIEHHESGWGSSTVKREELPRIGDGKPHSEKELPLRHWKFDPRTCALLKN